MDIARRVPMEFRAQAPGRCQRQFIKKPKDAPEGWRSDIQIWIDEWVERLDGRRPFTTSGLRLIEAPVNWRLISNSGVDEGIIRPVIGAGGWPLIPGSGIKGLFRRACPEEKRLRWCGSDCGEGDLSPGILRFHGAWPAEASWTAGLLDVAHPQQEWQVGIGKGKSGGAFGVVSLHKPRLLIGISCTDPSLSVAEWEEIETTLQRALRRGIGGRTCVGYGSSGRLSGELIFECALEGQGPAAKLLDGTAEFRPTMFRAAIRGMALRLFGGLTDEKTAREAVGRLFGSLNREEGQNVGLLATAYTEASSDLGTYGRGSWEQPIFATSGRLQWRQMRFCQKGEDEALLAELLAALHGITMSLGGFGKSWRRPDHRIFFPKYGKTPIGCHWQWREVERLPGWIHVQSEAQLGSLLQRSRSLASHWLKGTGQRLGDPAPWREVIDPRVMRIWIREAQRSDDAEAVYWFHNPKEGENQRDARDLRKSVLAGRVNQVGLIWNRLLPLLEAGETNSAAPGSRPPSPFARPGTAMARPANPMSRPAGGAMARPSAMRQSTAAPRGEVSIDAHSGRFLESLVLHACPPETLPDDRKHHQQLIDSLDRGAGANFKRLEW
jgi:CRISPR-associated protein Cmr6